MAKWLTHRDKKSPLRYKPLRVIAAIVLLIALLPAPRLSAVPLSQRSIRVSNGLAAQSGVTYRVTFSTLTSNLIGSVRVQFCSNTPLIDEPCTVPAGFDIASAALTSQSGMTGFSISSNTTANEMVIGRPPVVEGATASTYIFSGVTNPSSGGSLYARVFTYPTSDGTGAYLDAGGLALYFHGGLGVSAEVPPYLRFCLGESITSFDCTTATEPFSDIGVLTPVVTGSAQTQMVVATNADGGYSLWVQGGTMTSGTNTIPAMSGGPSQRGVSQFGINLRANASPIVGQDPAGPGAATISAAYNLPDQFRYQTGDTLVTATNPDDNVKFTVSYIVNVNANQPGGVYATTLVYIALANF
jgi:hypothetical protein